MPTGAYVFGLNIKTETVSLMPFGQFRELEAVSEQFGSLRPADYPEMKTGGKMVGWADMVSIRNGVKPFLAAISFDAKAKEKTTFGIPSIISIMGRKNFFQQKQHFVFGNFGFHSNRVNSNRQKLHCPAMHLLTAGFAER